MNTFAVLCILGALFSFCAACVWLRKRTAAEAAVLGAVIFFFSYIFGSMALFVADSFSLFRAAAAALAIDVFVLGAAVFYRKPKPFSLKKLVDIDFSMKDMLIPLVVCIVSLPFVSVKNEIFGMGQDEGVYQIQALNFMYDDNARQKDIEEYHLLEDAEDKAFFESRIKALGGYDIQHEDYPETVYDYDVSPVSGIFHGIPTYTAMLAMWGELFGAEDMADIETVFYIMAIFLVYYVCRNLRLKSSSRICACVLTALSPVVLWVAKSTLTEMFLAVILLTFMYIITDDAHPKQKWLSIIPAAAFGCYHVSVFTMLPLFVMVYGGMYVFTREKQYAILTPAVTAGYLASFFMMKQIQPMYTMNNYRDVFVGGINVYNITTAVTAASVGLMIASCVFVFIVSRTNKKFNQDEFSKKLSNSRIFRIFAAMLLILPLAYIAVKTIGKYDNWNDASHVAILGFGMNAGLVFVCLGGLLALFTTGRFIENNSRLVIFVMFFYCVLVYSAFLRFEIQYYYYYSRYLAPFIPVAVIFAALSLDRIGGKIVYPAAALSLVINMPYIRLQKDAKDDTRMEWSVLEDVTDFVDEDSCVVVCSKYAPELWLPLRTITDAHVYPLDESDPYQFMELRRRYDKVLCISDKELPAEEFVVYYKNIINHSEDDLNNTGEFVPLSLKYMEVQDDIYVYSYEKYKMSYEAAEDYRYFSGFSAVEGDFCWTAQENTEIRGRLYPDDYKATLSFGTVIPFDNLDTEEISVTMYINGKAVGSAEITPENNCSDITFDVPEEVVSDGENIIGFETDMWNTADVNPNDNRMVGIPFSSVVFEAV